MISTPSTSHRNRRLDVLRGFALFIVWVINLWSLSGFRQRLQLGSLDGVETLVYLAQAVWFEGKAYPLFALLFGMGCGWLMHKGGRYWFRRMLFLAVVGGLHLVFVWYGDILFTYALMGCVLWPLRRCSSATLVYLSVGLLSAKVWILLPIALIIPAHTDVAVGGMLFANESLGGVWLANLHQLAFKLQYYTYSARPLELLAMACLGLVAQRHVGQVVAHVTRYRLAYLLLGTACAMLSVAIEHRIEVFPPSGWLAVARGFQIPAQLGLVAAYSGYVLGSNVLDRWGAPLAAVGRCSFSAYLMQNLIAILLFYGPFLGLYGKLSLPVVSLIAVVIFAIQCCEAKRMIEHVQSGPIELLWRWFAEGVAVSVIRGSRT